MQRITFRANETLLKKARMAARREGKTLNHVFRDWLLEYTESTERAQKFDALMTRLQYVKARGHFTRDEMNEP